MVGAGNVAANKSALETGTQGNWEQEIIDAPANIALAHAWHWAPPGVMPSRCFELTESVKEPALDESTEAGAFFRGEPMIAHILPWDWPGPVPCEQR